MKNDLYMLIEMITDVAFGPAVMAKIVEVKKDDSGMAIVKSEYDYLGNEPIKIELEEDDDGVSFFSFTSKDEEIRTFVSDDAESSDYVSGDVLQDNEEVGEFIFRKITDIEWP